MDEVVDGYGPLVWEPHVALPPPVEPVWNPPPYTPVVVDQVAS